MFQLLEKVLFFFVEFIPSLSRENHKFTHHGYGLLCNSIMLAHAQLDIRKRRRACTSADYHNIVVFTVPKYSRGGTVGPKNIPQIRV